MVWHDREPDPASAAVLEAFDAARRPTCRPSFAIAPESKLGDASTPIKGPNTRRYRRST
jgi:hypothetical protein